MTSLTAQPVSRSAGDARTRALWCAALILFATFATYWRLIAQADFTNWDDSHNIVENPHMLPPTFPSLGWMWRNPQADLYVPVTYTAWWVLARASWMTDETGHVVHNPHVFHTANVALHALTALIVFATLRHLVRRGTAVDGRRSADFAACAGALLFAVHPLQVEPVAWASGLKDVLAGLLAIVAIDRYLAYASTPPEERSGAAPNYVLAVVAMVAAMLAKPSAVVAAPIAIVLDWLVLRRRTVDVLRGGIPLLVLTIPIIILGRINQSAAALTTGVSPSVRPLVATDALAFYAAKLVAPVRLCVDYGRNPAAAVEGGTIWWTWLVPAALALTLWIVRRAVPRPVLAGPVIFALALLPVLGLLPFDFQEYSTVADHYLYLPMFGVAMTVAGAIGRVGRAKSVIAFSIALLLTTLAVLSFLQTRFWFDSRSLFRRTVELNPTSWVGHNNLAQAISADGDQATAEPLVRRAIELKPNNPKSHLILGEILLNKGDTAGAIRAMVNGVRLNPRDVVGQVNLAYAYAHAGRYDNAIHHYQDALLLDPDNEKARRLMPIAIAYRDRQRATRPSPAGPTTSRQSEESPEEGAR